MRSAVIGGSVVVCLVVASIVAADFPTAGPAPKGVEGPAVANGGLIALAFPGNDHQQVTLIDPATRTLAVYHIDAAKGEVVLKSVRSVHYDLQMKEFNGTSPLPNDIRAMLQPR